MKLPRLRFSMLSLLTIVAGVAIGLVVWQQYVARPEAEKEYARLWYQHVTDDVTSEDVWRFEWLMWQFPEMIVDPRSIEWAAAHGDADLCRCLLERGADPRGRLAEEPGVPTPFDHAVKNNNVGTAKVLIEYGVDPNDKSSRGVSPLHAAALQGNVEMCQLLLDHGADIHQSELGGTPLLAALLSGNPQLVELLLEHGASFKLRNSLSYREAVIKIGVVNSIPVEDVEAIITLLEERLPLQRAEPVPLNRFGDRKSSIVSERLNLLEDKPGDLPAGDLP
ncbi:MULTISPECIES: ankyrin repeat domain-containing protein [Pirellulaceae]|nr:MULTISPECIES: ankyrin repeat domain-containing protein [Pirellulaceae]